MLEAKVYVDSQGCKYKVIRDLTWKDYWVFRKYAGNKFWTCSKGDPGFDNFDEAQQCLDLKARAKGWKEVK